MSSALIFTPTSSRRRWPTRWCSILNACHYYRLFQNTPFGRHCGVITSFEPNHNAISREPPNSDERYKFDTYTQHILKNGQTTKAYEDETKRRFIEEPANCKLLI